MAAEGVRILKPLPVPMPRQWGRDRLAAEGWPYYLKSSIIFCASMGPRPFGRGR